jgi:beta-glucanase (GH16 family)
MLGILIMAAGTTANAQLPQYPEKWPLPDVQMTPGASFCDTTPFKLVFYDNFDGYTDKSVPWPGNYNPLALDPEKWEIFSGASGYGINPVRRAQEVEPNNGTGVCVLHVRKEEVNTENGKENRIFVGEIQSTGKWGTFNKGRFEARISFPAYAFAHSNFYVPTWSGQTVNISVCETYGDPLHVSLRHFRSNYHRHMEWSTSMAVTDQYNFFEHTRSPDGPSAGYEQYAALFDSFHVYRADWDETQITWYIDGRPVKQTARYLAAGNGEPIYSCGPYAAGTYRQNPGFPWDQAWVKMILQTWPDKDVWPNTTTEIGAMKIDWVKVYQRHPDKNLNYGDTLHPHYDLCARRLVAHPSGSDAPFRCNLQGAALSTGNHITWHTSANLAILGTPGWHEITVKRVGGGDTGWVEYSDDNPDCPVARAVIALPR